MLFYVLGLTVQ